MDGNKAENEMGEDSQDINNNRMGYSVSVGLSFISSLYSLNRHPASFIPKAIKMYNDNVGR